MLLELPAVPVEHRLRQRQLPAQDAHEVVTDLGRERLRLGEHDPEELLGILGQQFDPLEGTRRLPGQSYRLRRKERPTLLIAVAAGVFVIAEFLGTALLSMLVFGSGIR